MELALQVQKEDHFQEEVPVIDWVRRTVPALRHRAWRTSRGSRRILLMHSRKAGSTLLERRAQVSTVNRNSCMSI